MQEELMIPLRASQRRSGDAEDVPAAKHHVTRQALDRRPVMYRVADDAALPDMLPSDLELRLHQSDDFPARGEDAEHRGKDLLERDERHIDDRERGLLAEDPRVEGPRVGVFHHDDALVFAEPRVELARADVHGVYARGATLEQAVGESAGRSADVQADTSGHLDLEAVDRVHELLAPTAHVRGASPQLDSRPGRHERARLVPALAADEHVTREDLPGGLFTAVHQPLADEHPVDPDTRTRWLHYPHHCMR